MVFTYSVYRVYPYTTEFRVPARSCQGRGLNVVIQTHEVFRWQHLEVIRAQLAPLQSHGIVKQKHQAKKKEFGDGLRCGQLLSYIARVSFNGIILGYKL